MVEVVNPAVESSVPTPIDVGSQLYIHPSDSAGAVLVPVPFDGVGFSSWKRGVLRSLFTLYVCKLLNWTVATYWRTLSLGPNNNNTQKNPFNPNNSNFNSNYRGYKGKGTAANVHGEPSCSSERDDLPSPNGHLNTLSTEQYNHLINMLKAFQGGNMKDPFTVNGAANFAGPFTEEASGDW
uniref:Retrotransposon Copia-like N-terminal domain-containing protein n=1 Tax=Solanum tuberosum TaxID=4113 RepID=M1DD83_SOLTU